MYLRCVYEPSHFVQQCFKHGNAVELHNGKMFDFHLGLPHVTQLFMNLIKAVFTHWPSKCLLLATYTLASGLTDMVTATYNTAKCINSECFWAHYRYFWCFWPIYIFSWDTMHCWGCHQVNISMLWLFFCQDLPNLWTWSHFGMA